MIRRRDMPGHGERTVPERVALLEADILTTRADQRSAQGQLEEAAYAELHALTLLDQSRSIQDRARRQVATYAETISSLQDELAALLPVSRPPS